MNMNFPNNKTLSYAVSIVAAVSLLASVDVNAPAAQTSSAPAEVTAALVSAISIEVLVDLNFGGIITGSAQSVFHLEPTSSPFAGPGTLTRLSGNATSRQDHQQAEFRITGPPGEIVSITLPGSTTIMNPDGQTMLVTNITDHPSIFFVEAGFLMQAAGEQEISIGADLTVGANQAGGVYTGTFDFTANF